MGKSSNGVIEDAHRRKEEKREGEVRELKSGNV